MIEAIPTSLDRLILVITKVEDPDELDTRFSKFSPDPSADSYEDEDDEEDEDILNCLNNLDSYTTTSEAEASPEFVPLPDCLGLQAEKKEEEEEAKAPKTTTDMMKAYSFPTLSAVSEAAIHLAGVYQGENRVYKHPKTGVYYLVLFRSGHTADDFGRVCNLLSEYARPERTSYATLAHMQEHFEPILKQDALAILAAL